MHLQIQIVKGQQFSNCECKLHQCHIVGKNSFCLFSMVFLVEGSEQ